MDTVPLDVGFVLAVATVATAVVQVAVARRLDLGPLTLALGASAVAGSAPAQAPSALLVLAGVLAALGWRAGAASGVGRPDLAGLVLAVAAMGLLAPGWLGPLVPSVPAAALVAAGQGATLLAGALTVPLARERKGLAGQRVFHYREVPVTTPSSERS